MPCVWIVSDGLGECGMLGKVPGDDDRWQQSRPHQGDEVLVALTTAVHMRGHDPHVRTALPDIASAGHARTHRASGL